MAHVAPTQGRPEHPVVYRVDGGEAVVALGMQAGTQAAETLAGAVARGVPGALEALVSLVADRPDLALTAAAVLQAALAAPDFALLLHPNPVWFQRRAVRRDAEVVRACLGRVLSAAHGSARLPIPSTVGALPRVADSPVFAPEQLPRPSVAADTPAPPRGSQWRRCLLAMLCWTPGLW